MLDGPLVRQDMTGRIALSGATLTTAEGVPALLFSDPENHAYAAMNPTSHQSRFSLRTPQLTATIDSLGFGRVELLGLDPTTLNIDAVSLDGRLTLAPGPNGSPVELGRIEIVVNGRQLTGGQDRETTIYYDLSESIK